MLHILTPLHRFELLTKVYLTIPNHADITWHIAKSNMRFEKIPDLILNDKRVIIHHVDCIDKNIVAKQNAMLDSIKDGYFYHLDNDTIFLNETFEIYKYFENIHFKGMIIGNQKISKNIYINKAHFPNTDPSYSYIDTGMVISHHEVLRTGARWRNLKIGGLDNIFWSKIYEYWGKGNTVLVDRDISIYNFFSPKIRVRKKIFALKIYHEIYNPYIAFLYIGISKILNVLREKFGIRQANIHYEEMLEKTFDYDKQSQS